MKNCHRLLQKESLADVQLHAAARRGDLVRLRHLLDSGRVYVDSRDKVNHSRSFHPIPHPHLPPLTPNSPLKPMLNFIITSVGHVVSMTLILSGDGKLNEIGMLVAHKVDISRLNLPNISNISNISSPCINLNLSLGCGTCRISNGFVRFVALWHRKEFFSNVLANPDIEGKERKGKERKRGKKIPGSRDRN